MFLDCFADGHDLPLAREPKRMCPRQRHQFEPKPVASVQGSFNDLSGEFASLAGSRKPHAVEIASRRIKLSVVASKQGGDLQFTMDTDSPDRLEIDGQPPDRQLPGGSWRAGVRSGGDPA